MADITLTILKNPFNHNDREIKKIAYVPGKTVSQYVQPVLMGIDFKEVVVSRNGAIVNEEQLSSLIVESGDYIAACPVIGKGGGKNILATIAGIALMTYTSGIVNPTTGWAAKGAASSFMANVAASAISMLGGMLINHLFPQPVADIPEVATSTPAYSWGNLQSLSGQGNALAVTYGTMRTAGQILAQHITNGDGDKQYLNLLLCGGEGPIDSITDIKINENPISYYKDVAKPIICYGTNNQEAIPYFNDTYADQALNYELVWPSANDWSNAVTQQTEGNGGEGLEITFECPNGLYYANDKGGLDEATVRVQGRYRAVGANDWIYWGEWTITAAKSSAVRKVCRLDNLPPGKYEVQCRCSYKKNETESPRYSTKVYWTQLSHIIYEDFSHPGKVLVAISALATDQLSGGLPTVTWLQSVKNVNVYINGQYEEQSARNPAWVAYDLLHRCKKMKNTQTGADEYKVFGIPANRIDYQAFADWATFCTERNLNFEYIFDTASDLWSSLQKPESVGRGKVILKGTRYSCICDRPSQPIQLFTMGNMVQDKFQEDFLGMKDRANAVEITFVNKDKGYQKDAITIYDNNWDDSQIIQNPTQITLYGCTSYEQAYREGKYRLRLNQYLQRTISFDADIDAIACQVGDVILIQHDLPQWGYGGRVLAATENTIQLDRNIAIEAGKEYSVMVRLSDDTLVEKQVVGAVAETDTVTVSTPFSSIPQKWDVFSFGETHKVTKPFRVLNISRSQEFKRSITALEYVEEVYKETDIIPVLNYNDLDNSVPEVGSLNLGQQTYKQKDGTIVSEIDCSWVVPKKHIKNSIVWYSRDEGQSWILWGNTTNNLAVITGVKSQETYLVKVCTLNNAGVISPGVISKKIYITGKDEPPSNIDSIVAEVNPSDSTKLILKWSAVTDIDLKGYQLSEGSTILTPTPINDNQYVFTATKSRQYNFSVVAIDNSGNPSTIPARTSINIIIGPAQVADFAIAPLDSDRSRLRMQWTANSESDISYYEIRLGENWDTAHVVATQLKATLFECTLASAGSITYLIKAVNIAGKYSVSPSAITKQYTLTPNASESGIIIQDANDRSLLIISWLAIDDKDLSQYEIRLGTNWATAMILPSTKETTCKYKVSSGGVYNFMICSKNVAGYYSSALNLQISAYILPTNVTGFTIAPSPTDRRLLNCQWNAVTDADLSCYEIRQGTNWNTATPVATRIKGNFYSIQFPGGNATFLIKAISVSENYSDSATSFTVAIPTTPSSPGSGSAISDPQNRFSLTLSWGAVSDTDLQDYEIRKGSVWSTAALIANTKETSYRYTVNSGGTHTFLVCSRTVGGQYSQTRALTTSVVQEPLDVTTFTAMQNPLDRRTINLMFSAVIETDLAGYEIRKGSSWDTATVIASNLKTTKYDYTATISETAVFLVKAITVSGKYSNNAKSVNITIQLEPNKPGVGGIVQDDNNSAIQILSWGAISDADLQCYEIRKGTVFGTGILVATTKEQSYRYTATSNTPLTFCIAAKNIGGYYSPDIQLTTTPNVNPQDVSGFTAFQLVQDHSKVRLNWNGITNKDFSYYEIREGVNWDVGTVIGTRISSLFYDTSINTERQYTYWIKAFNLAGKDSLNPNSASSIFNMHPSSPDGLTITTDPNEKTKLNLSWNPIGDQDLKEYELRVGISWNDTNTVIVTKTKESKAIYYPPTSQNYHFMLVARNNTNWISDVVENTYASYIEPIDVSEFHAMQNGSNCLLTWDKVNESDVVGYEIREGSNFDNGSLVTTGINTLNYQVPVDTEKTYCYWIKAINRAGRYSQNAMSAEVTIIGLPPKNVVKSFDEIALKSGIHTNTEFGASLINFSNMGGRFSDYPNTKFSDVGGQMVLKLKKSGNAYPPSGEYLVQRKDVGQIITANISSQFVSTNLLTSGVNAKLQYRISRDGINFTDWQDFQPVEATFRYVDFKVVMNTADGTNTPEVNILQEVIDVPDTDKYGTSTIAITGTTVSYGYTYYDYPSVIPTAIGAGLRAELQSVDKSSFVVKVLNTAGATVGGQITWIARGY